MTEDGAVALYVGVAQQSALDLRRNGVQEADRLSAWEYLRHLGLTRAQLHKLLALAENKQKDRDNGRARRVQTRV